MRERSGGGLWQLLLKSKEVAMTRGIWENGVHVRVLEAHMAQVPLLYLFFVYDIIISWTHEREALEDFHHCFNNFQPTIDLSLD